MRPRDGIGGASESMHRWLPALVIALAGPGALARAAPDPVCPQTGRAAQPAGKAAVPPLRGLDPLAGVRRLFDRGLCARFGRPTGPPGGDVVVRGSRPARGRVVPARTTVVVDLRRRLPGTGRSAGGRVVLAPAEPVTLLSGRVALVARLSCPAGLRVSLFGAVTQRGGALATGQRTVACRPGTARFRLRLGERARTRATSPLRPGRASVDLSAFGSLAPAVGFRFERTVVARLSGPPVPLPALLPGQRWRFDAGGDYALVAADGGGVYVASGRSGNPASAGLSTNAVWGLDPATGRPRWRVPTRTAPLRPTVANGTVYVGLADGSLIALDATIGRRLWRTGIGLLAGPPVAIGDIVVVGSTAPERHQTQVLFRPRLLTGEVVAVDARTGVVLWRHATGGREALVAADASRIFVGAADPRVPVHGVLLALDLGGQVLWARPAGTAAQPVAAAETVYSLGPALEARDAATGSVRWTAETGAEALAVVGDTIYTNASGVGEARNLEAREASSGRLLWSSPIGDTGSPPSVSDDGVVYIVSSGLVRLDAATGRQLTVTPAFGAAGPVVLGGALAYVGGFGGLVYGLER